MRSSVSIANRLRKSFSRLCFPKPASAIPEPITCACSWTFWQIPGSRFQLTWQSSTYSLPTAPCFATRICLPRSSSTVKCFSSWSGCSISSLKREFPDLHQNFSCRRCTTNLTPCPHLFTKDAAYELARVHHPLFRRLVLHGNHYRNRKAVHPACEWAWCQVFSRASAEPTGVPGERTHPQQCGQERGRDQGYDACREIPTRLFGGLCSCHRCQRQSAAEVRGGRVPCRSCFVSGSHTREH